MKFLMILLMLTNVAYSQPGKTAIKSQRPKLIVGIAVDQMRWDFLYRYHDRYLNNGGFKRLLNKGFSCDNMHINYIPTYTACGHAALYTGTVPAINGITGNEWWEVPLKQEMYCVQDDSVQGVGTDKKAGQMSPRNLFVTTICDELKLATNFRSKVIGVAFKDRGGILPAGHAADAAYWYEPASGKFITSTYYMSSLPDWVNTFNNRKLPEYYLKRGWNTLYPIESYRQSTPDQQSFEGSPFGDDQKRFPYRLEKFIGKDYGALTFTPFGNTVTREMAMAAVMAEGLGKDSITDFLAVSFSTPDYIGHAFGPNSIEVEDNYLRLDQDLGELFNFLDKQVGRGEYLVFLSSDHGAAHSAGFMQQHKIPGASVPYGIFQGQVDSVLRSKFGNYKFVLSEQNAQLFFDHHVIDSLQLDRSAIAEAAITFLMKQPEIDRAFAYADAANIVLPERLKQSIINAYYPKRSGDVQYLIKPGFMMGATTGTTHGSPYAYDTHLPLLWYGWNIKPGKTSREIHITDVAPTLAAMLRIQMPNGSIGEPIGELVNGEKNSQK